MGPPSKHRMGNMLPVSMMLFRTDRERAFEYKKRSDPEKAIKDFMKAVKDPKTISIMRASAHYEIAILHKKLGRDGEAIRYCQHALGMYDKTRGPSHAQTLEVRCVVADLLGKTGGLQQALDQCNIILGLSLDDGNPYLLQSLARKAMALTCLQQDDKAHECHLAAVQHVRLLGSDYEYHLAARLWGLGSSSLKVKEHGRAIAVFEEVLPILHLVATHKGGALWRVHLYKGLALYNQEQFDRAIADYEFCLAILLDSPCLKRRVKDRVASYLDLPVEAGDLYGITHHFFGLQFQTAKIEQKLSHYSAALARLDTHLVPFQHEWSEDAARAREICLRAIQMGLEGWADGDAGEVSSVNPFADPDDPFSAGDSTP